MSEQQSIRVVIADDNRPFRRGVRLRLEQADGIVVVGEAATGVDAVAAALAANADVVLMDLEMPGMNGIDATRELADAAGACTRIIVLTSHGEDQLVVRALKNGASGYLLKTHDNTQLVDAIRATARGEAHVSPRVTAPLLREFTERRLSVEDEACLTTLSRSERRVVQLLSQGVTSNEDLAGALVVSVNTVRSHVQSAMRKVAASDRTQLALWGSKVKDELAARPIGRI